MEITAKVPGLDLTNKVIQGSTAAKRLGVDRGMTAAGSLNQMNAGVWSLLFPYAVGEFRHMKDDYQLTKFSVASIKRKIPAFGNVMSLFPNKLGWNLAMPDPVYGFIKKTKVTKESVFESVQEMDYTTKAAEKLFNIDTAAATAAKGLFPDLASTFPDSSTKIDLIAGLNPENVLNAAFSDGQTATQFSSSTTQATPSSAVDQAKQGVIAQLHESIDEAVFGDSEAMLPAVGYPGSNMNGYVFYQKSKSNKWLVPNSVSNINSNKLITVVFDEEGYEILYDEFFIDKNYNITLTFEEPVIGRAVIFRLDEVYRPEIPPVDVDELLEALSEDEAAGAAGTTSPVDTLDPLANSQIGPDLSQVDLNDPATKAKVEEDLMGGETVYKFEDRAMLNRN